MNIIYHLLSIIIKSCYLLFLVSNIYYELLLEIGYYYYESLFIYNLFLKPFFLSFTICHLWIKYFVILYGFSISNLKKNEGRVSPSVNNAPQRDCLFVLKLRDVLQEREAATF